MAEGITPRHARTCGKSKKKGEARKRTRCTCKPTYQAQAYDRQTSARPTKTFDDEQEAIDWRAEKMLEIRKGTFRPGRQVTLRVAFNELISDMRAGIVRNRSGERYKPSVIRGYERDIANHLMPAFGSAKPVDIRGGDVQRLVSRLERDGKAASTIRNILMPLRVLYRRLLRLEELTLSPMDHLELPAVRGKRLRIAPPAEAAELVAAVPAGERAIWATAMYAGLRLGELEALDVEEIDLATGLIRVEWNWDPVERCKVAPKSAAGRRTVPVPAILREFLLDRRMALGRTRGHFFGPSADEPFNRDSLRRRADAAWEAENDRRRGAAKESDAEPALLERVTPHDCRHTYASLMISAMSESPQGFNPKLLSTYMGHATIAITIDRYGHLFPGNEKQAAGALDAFLQRSDTAARKAAVSGE
jgi:integrase